MRALIQFLLKIPGIFVFISGLGHFFLGFMSQSIPGYVIGSILLLLGVLLIPANYISIQKYFLKYINKKIFILMYILLLIVLYIVTSVIIPMKTSYLDDMISLGEKAKEVENGLHLLSPNRE